MSGQDDVPKRNFEEQLFDFLDEEEPNSLDCIKEELRECGIDVETQMAWVKQYVEGQLTSLSKERLHQAASARNLILKKLAEFRAKGIMNARELLENLKSTANAGGAGNDLALQAQFSKLEDPTEDDLLTIVEEWLELGELDQEETPPDQ